MRQVERQVLLQVIDLKWREHLYEMDYLKEGIGLRAMGQRDPLIEYQREAHQMFGAMSDAVKEQALQVLYRVEKRESTPQAPQAVDATSAATTARTAPRATAAMVALPLRRGPRAMMHRRAGLCREHYDRRRSGEVLDGRADVFGSVG